MEVRTAGGRIRSTAGQKAGQRDRTAFRQTSAGNMTASRAESGRETASVIQLAVCTGAFVTLVAVKILLPSRLAPLQDWLNQAMERNMDVEAVFSALGERFAGEGDGGTEEIWQAVFSPSDNLSDNPSDTGENTDKGETLDKAEPSADWWAGQTDLESSTGTAESSPLADTGNSTPSADTAPENPDQSETVRAASGTADAGNWIPATVRQAAETALKTLREYRPGSGATDGATPAGKNEPVPDDGSNDSADSGSDSGSNHSADSGSGGSSADSADSAPDGNSADSADSGSGGSPADSTDNPSNPEIRGTPDTAPAGEGGAVLYSGKHLPAGVYMEQVILNFDYCTPVMGTLTSGFGWRTHAVTQEEKFHYGVDLAAEAGTEILCFADGTVSAVGESTSYGKYCIVSHPGNLSSLYAHCSSVTAQVGQEIRIGEKLGEVGATGDATGPHLHFALQRGGDYLNPIYYIAHR